MDNTINDTIFKNKYLKYKKKYLYLKYFIGGKKHVKNTLWVNKFNTENKNSFILFFNMETLINKFDESYETDKQHLDKLNHDINTIISKYSEAIKSNDYDKKTLYVISDAYIFNNLSLYKYKLGHKVKNKYIRGYILPWLKLSHYNSSTVEKSSSAHFINSFLPKLKKLKQSINKNKLNINNKNLIKSFNFNNYQTLLTELISTLNLSPNNYINKVITITNEYNLMSTKSVILNGIEEVIDSNVKQQYQKASKPMEITNWMKISNVKYNNKNHTFTFNILEMDPNMLQSG